MKEITFVTGNQNKADYLAKYLDMPLKHVKLELDEIQSVDSKKIVEHKVRQAYEKIQTPVLVEDGSLSFEAMGKLPGPFIRFFVSEMPLEEICRLLDGKSRKATATTTFGYFDGTDVTFFEGKLEGTIADAPAGENGWDWDKIFIPEGYNKTRAQLDEKDYGATALHLRPFEELKKFFTEA